MVAAVARTGSLVATLSALDGVIAMGVFLMLVALFGLVAVFRRSSVGVFLVRARVLCAPMSGRYIYT